MATFKRRGSRIISSEGWYVQTLGRFGIRYKDAAMSFRVGAEMMAEGPVAYVVCLSEMRPDLLSRIRNVDANTRQLIGERISAALHAIGLRVEFA